MRPTPEEALDLLEEVAHHLFVYDDETNATLYWQVANKVWRAFGFGTIPVARCDNCDHEEPYDEYDFHSIKDLELRLDPGGTVPVRECSECRALSYSVKK